MKPDLRGIERPSRYIGDEFGLLPPPSGEVRLRVALGFPDVYEVGMSHLGFRLLHAELMALPGVHVERVFLPWPDMQDRLDQQGIPLPTQEGRLALAEVDLLGLSVQYELAYTSVLKLLDLAGIPRFTAQRESGRWPLVLVGGTAALNPEPLAPFVDAFFVGEADEAMAEIVDCVARHRHGPRSTLLKHLGAVEGIYIPGHVEVHYDPGGLDLSWDPLEPRRLSEVVVRRRKVKSLDRLDLPSLHLVPLCNVVHDRVTIEIQRGCCQGCRFCQAGFVTRPTRQRGVGRVLEAARRLLSQTGYQEMALLSLSAGDHPCLQEMLAALIQEHASGRVAVSLPSLRTETLAASVAKQISQTRRTTFTLAPEAATERLRRVINKQNTDEDLLRSVRSVVSAGFGRIKLYFMIGLPTETDHDVEAIPRLARQVAQEAKKAGRSVGLSLSISIFVPKPHTPFQWAAAPEPEQVHHKRMLVQAAVPRGIRLSWHDYHQSQMEALLARGDRRLARVLDRVVDEKHRGMDAWTERFNAGRWREVLEESASAGEIPDPALYLQARDPLLPLPWDLIHVGVERDYLLRQWQDAQDELERPDCTGGACDDCGVCPAEPLHELAREGALSGPGDPPRQGSRPQQEAGDGEDDTTTYVRLWFHKLGRASLIGHLEQLGAFERAVRRAGLPLAYSRGFHPKPRLRFSPALPLGAESLCEFVEIGLSHPITPPEVLERLSIQLPSGFEIQQSEAVGQRKLHKHIRGVRWRLEPARPMEEAALEAVRQQMARGPVMLQRRKGRPRDLSALVQELRREEQGGVEVCCRFDEQGTVRPEEIMRVLLKMSEAEIQQTAVTRVDWEVVEEL